MDAFVSQDAGTTSTRQRGSGPPAPPQAPGRARSSLSRARAFDGGLLGAAQLAAPLRELRGLVWMRVGRHSAGPLRSSRKCRPLRSWQPPPTKEPRDLVWMCLGRHSARPSRCSRMCRWLCSWQHPKEPRGLVWVCVCVCMTSIRCASRQLTNVLAAAQFAAPQGDARSSLVVRMTSPRWRSSRTCQQLRSWQHPQGDARSTGCA